MGATHLRRRNWRRIAAMGIEGITLALDGTTVAPASDDDWTNWLSTTALRGYLGGDTLGDWLDHYGEASGFVRDDQLPDYDERLEFPPFIIGKGGEFERAIAPVPGSTVQSPPGVGLRDGDGGAHAVCSVFVPQPR